MAERTIVLDNGSGTIHAGFAEDDNPILSFPNYSETGLGFGSNVNFVDLSTSESYKSYVMSSNNGNLKMTWPIEHGIIKNWESMESVWDYTFSTALRIQPDEYNILITEAIMNPKANREKMAQILFEKYNFQAIHVPHSAMLPLYSSGLTTGLVLDCGDGVIQAVPVWGGYPITDAMIRVDMGGRDITNHLATLLRDNDHDMKPMEVVRLIKEKACSVAQDFVKQSELQEKESFELPDGEVIELGNERFACAELLFNPSTDSLSDKIGVHEVLYKSIMKTNIDIRKDLYGNIVLSGGSTLFPGFLDRLSKEIVALVPPKAKITINADPGRKYSTWLGGSVLASLSSFNRLLISKDEFEEVGPSILITK